MEKVITCNGISGEIINDAVPFMKCYSCKGVVLSKYFTVVNSDIINNFCSFLCAVKWSKMNCTGTHNKIEARK